MSRVAVVTGGGSGMGRAICRHLAQQGRKVAVLDVAGDMALEVAKELQSDGFEAFGVAVDVSDRSAVEAALDEVRRELGRIEIMVTSAGIEGFEDFLDITAESWDRMMAVNCPGPSTASRRRCPTCSMPGGGASSPSPPRPRSRERDGWLTTSRRRGGSLR